VHDAGKIIKNLRAMLRLTRGALGGEGRRARNQALRNLADPLSGRRDAAVKLAAFENVYPEGSSRHACWFAELDAQSLPGGASRFFTFDWSDRWEGKDFCVTIN